MLKKNYKMMDIYKDGSAFHMDALFEGPISSFLSADKIIRSAVLTAKQNGVDVLQFKIRSFSTVIRAKGKMGRHFTVAKHIFTTGLSIALICKYALELNQQVEFEFKELGNLTLPFNPSLSGYKSYGFGKEVKLLKIYADNDSPVGSSVTALYGSYDELMKNGYPLLFIHNRINRVLNELKDNNLVFYANLPMIENPAYETRLANYTYYSIAYLLNECMQRGIDISTHHKKEGETFPWTEAINLNNMM